MSLDPLPFHLVVDSSKPEIRKAPALKQIFSVLRHSETQFRLRIRWGLSPTSTCVPNNKTCNARGVPVRTVRTVYVRIYETLG